MKKDKNNKNPKHIDLTLEQIEALEQRISTNNLTQEDLGLFSELLFFVLWLQRQLASAKLSIKRLKGLFGGFKTEKKKPPKDEDDPEEQSDTAVDSQEKNDPSAPDASNDEDETNTNGHSTQKKKPRKQPVWSASANHGRYGFGDYPGCNTVVLYHPTLKPGDICPGCKDCNPPGKLSFRKKSGSLVRLIGQSLITGTRYEVKILDCHLCDASYKAPIPLEIKNAKRYSASAKAAIAVAHYSNGLPFKRLEAWQANYQIPVPDATQYDKIAELEKTILPVYEVLEYSGAQGKLLTYDDTTHRILECMADPKEKRKGVYSTAVVCELGHHTITLFYTDQKYAGKEVEALLKQRKTDEPLLTMRDASSMNNLKDLDESLLIKLIIAFCLVHGRRKFYELIDDFPKKCGIVIDTIAMVYQNETHCKKNNLTDDERLRYHQLHSKPIMDALWVWFNNLWSYKGLEPNSSFGQAVSYMLRHWQALTQFLRVAGIPLDSSIAERAIKVVIRYRRSSLFYKTLKSARVGDRIMSLIHTAIRNGVNAFEYLTVLQENYEAVAKEPESWLPWNYKQTLAEPLIKAA